MKKICFFILLSVFTISTLKAQNGSVRILPDFKSIVFNSTGNVVINQGDVNGVRLSGDEAAKNKAVIEVRDGKLYIDKLSNRNTAYVTFVKINRISLNGTGKMESSGLIKSDDLRIENDGAAKGDFAVETTDLTATLGGVGRTTLSGTTKNMVASISGTGPIQASKLVAQKVTANISGIGSLFVDVKEELNANISGTGSVRYVTPPNVINKDISGIGNVGNKNAAADSTRITIGDKEILIIDRNPDSDDNIEEQIRNRQNQTAVKPFWGGFDLGFNGYVNADNKTTLPDEYKFLELEEGKSIAVNINFFDSKIKLQKDHLWLVTGLGLSYNNYRFSKKDFKLAPKADEVTAIIDSSFNFDKSKLVATYVRVPFMLQVNTSKSIRNNFHLTFGGIFGYRLGSHAKYVTKDGSRKKEKERDDFNLEPIRLDARVSLGYKKLNVFADYTVTELFKSDEGPELHPYTFGITLIGW